MIYIKTDILTVIPRSCSEIGIQIQLVNSVDKTEFRNALVPEADHYVSNFINVTRNQLPEGQYKYAILTSDEKVIQTGIAQVGDFTNESKSYTEKTVYKQYTI